MFVQNPIETLTNVVQSVTAKGQPDITGVLDTGKQRSTFLAFESCSSDTSVAANATSNSWQGLQEYSVMLVDDAIGCCLKAAN